MRPWKAGDSEWIVLGRSAGESALYTSSVLAAGRFRGQVAARTQVRLLREIFGNPFRPIATRPDWLTWHGGAIVQLAQSIYDDRHFEELPILADALEEAGCTEAVFLKHCRSRGEHVRGCWVVDLLLGKE